jgi:serine protease Do
MLPFDQNPNQDPNQENLAPKQENLAPNQDSPPMATSYVYPQPGSAGGAPPLSSPPARKHFRTVGLVALLLSVAVLLSALTGGLVYTVMKNQNLPATTTVQTTTGASQTEQTTAPTTAGTKTGNVTNKNFNIADAATRTDPNRKSLSIMEIAAQGKPAVVAINTEGTVTDLFGQTGNFQAAGSGFIITQDGYIVTNNHVIEGAKTITVVLDNGDIYEGALVGTDTRNDIAVIKITGNNFPTVYLGNSATLEVGELAVAIGNPLGELSGTVTAGIISALDRLITLEGQSMHLLQTDAAINAGNSGGALFDSFGDVIGINTAKNTGSGVEGLGFAIPIDIAKPIIESLIKYGYVQGRPKIGISTRDVTQQMADYYHLTVGVFVYSVETGSAADEAGLIKEDIIIAANGTKVTTTADLSDIKDKLKPGDTLVLTIVRGGKQMTVNVVLKEDVPSAVTPAASTNGTNPII